MFRTKAEEAYENDSEFHRLVDMLEMMLNESRLTPSEVRMAAVLACCHREMHRIDFYVPTGLTCSCPKNSPTPGCDHDMACQLYYSF